MQKQFHGYTIDLDIYDKDASTLIPCYIRKKDLVLTPEEEVRQALLKFIYEFSDIDTSLFITFVEYRNLDVAFSTKFPSDDFQPVLDHFIIIETKNDLINLINFENQIKKYLKLHNCKIGFLLHSHLIYLLSDENKYTPTKIDINDFSKQFKLSHVSFQDDYLLFENARNGDFDCFKQLARKYGGSNKISFVTKDHPSPIAGFLFNFIDDYIFFDICGVKATSRKHKIVNNNFLKLESIK